MCIFFLYSIHSWIFLNADYSLVLSWNIIIAGVFPSRSLYSPRPLTVFSWRETRGKIQNTKGLSFSPYFPRSKCAVLIQAQSDFPLLNSYLLQLVHFFWLMELEEEQLWRVTPGYSRAVLLISRNFDVALVHIINESLTQIVTRLSLNEREFV